MKRLTHLDESGEVSMVDVGPKSTTSREAVAESIVAMSAETIRAVTSGTVPKGNVFTTARIAGILAAKQTSTLIPLTHPLPITYVHLDLTADETANTVRICATVRCDGKTGVEIEALTAASIAALTVYDMCKGLDKGIVIRATRLISKRGGASGDFRAPGVTAETGE